MRIKVTVTAFSKNQELRNELLKYFPESTFNELGKRFTKDELIEYLSDCDGAIVGLDKIDSEVLSACKNLKVIAKFGVGLDNINQDDCKLHNVAVKWVGGVNKSSVAEMTLGFMIGLNRNLFYTSKKLSNGIWDKNGGTQLKNKCIGIIGVGHIGKELIKMLQPFNCKILVNDIINQDKYYQDNNLIEASKDEIFQNADIISLHVPLTTDTFQLINKNNLIKMKSSTFLINTARGEIINQSDLKEALQNNTIAGCALDVFEEEPPRDLEFLRLENLVATPHIGGNSYEAVIAMGKSAMDGIKEYFSIKEIA